MTGRERDEDLIRAHQRGEEASFGELVALHAESVRRLAYRVLHDEEEAKDVSQEAFFALYRVLPAWRFESRVFTWLYRTTLNISLRRREKRRPALSLDPEGPPAADAKAPPAVLEERARRRTIEEAVASLPARQRLAFILHHREELPLAEVARVLSVKPSTVKTHLTLAVASLRRKLRGLLER